MTTIISHFGNHSLIVSVPDLNMHFACDSSDINKQHNGIWNSRVMAFVPKLPDTFSDGQPVEHTYQDHSGIYFDHCVVCGVDTKGNKYCGASCEQHDAEGGA